MEQRGEVQWNYRPSKAAAVCYGSRARGMSDALAAASLLLRGTQLRATHARRQRAWNGSAAHPQHDAKGVAATRERKAGRQGFVRSQQAAAAAAAARHAAAACRQCKLAQLAAARPWVSDLVLVT